MSDAVLVMSVSLLAGFALIWLSAQLLRWLDL